MEICKKVLFLFLLSFLSFPTFSDTIPPITSDTFSIPEKQIVADITVRDNPSYIRKYTDFTFVPTYDFSEAVDTSLAFFHRYNPAYKNFYYTIGNIGLAHHAFIFQPNLIPGFNFGVNNFNLWELSSENISFYNTRIPYSEANLVVGSNKEQYFKGIHTQNITKDWNFSFQFNKIKSLGFYRNQYSDGTNIGTQTNYLSKNKKYGILAKASYNNIIAAENGGLNNENFIEEDSRLTTVNLSSAFNRKNSREASVKQYFNFTSLVDSLPDSDTSFIYNYKVNKGFSHFFSINDERMTFKDENIDVSFYPSIFQDSLSTLDSVHLKTVNNNVSWNNYNNWLIYNLSFGHQYSEVYFNHSNKNFYFSNYTLKSYFASSKKVNYFWNINSSYILFGDNKGDFTLDAEIDYSLRKNHLFSLEVAAIQASPFFNYNYFYSNHFRWENNFKKNQVYSFKISYNNPKLKVKSSVNSSMLSNYIYFNYDAIPEQHLSTISVSTFKFEKNFTWKRFNLLSELIYQKVSAPEIVRVPDLITRNALFYEFGSKKDLKLQVGIEGLYFTSFKNYRYMPVTRQFYLQDEQSQGNYPFVDFFVNMRIKQARVFFKVDHLNENLLGRNFFILPGYAAGERAFRVGVSWIFYN